MTAKLSDAEIKLIERKNFGYLATLNADGSPQVTPVWVDREGDTILVNTAEGRVKQKNLRRDPRVALAVADQNNPYNRTTIRGKVIEQTNAGADAHIDKMAKKYIGQDKYPWRAPGEKRVILKIEPQRITTA
ncbi:MAG: PPOX class F420-dependent oxidoreductase [Candidatus Bathyarchaeia archaeon]